MFKHNDGGREDSGLKGKSGDCAVRALSIATGIGYKDSQKIIKEFAAKGKQGNKAISRGVYKEDLDAALESIGWKWCKAPKFDGRKARYSDIDGVVIVRMARHYAAVVNGVLNDTWDSSDKMVYGYWAKA